ncbi:hypothetical protein HPB52_022970 [Rhipicephalus sanguineus]|uniref:Uncharacterized protein n=1 Tax=Rhipicephalus sanguineus TaxID=34632 RepID=A0A9D4PKS0_RHISA|nr:hypothetical protein HPB52_022970 [Rhipicephalus sanguineus]
MIYKTVFWQGLVNKSNAFTCLKYLESSPLYKHLGITIDWNLLGKYDDENHVPNEKDDLIEAALNFTDLIDSMQVSVRLNSLSFTIIYDDSRYGLVDQTHCVHMAPGEGERPICLLFDEYAEEWDFPHIYLCVHCRITAPHPTAFMKASIEIRRKTGEAFTHNTCSSWH